MAMDSRQATGTAVAKFDLGTVIEDARGLIAGTKRVFFAISLVGVLAWMVLALAFGVIGAGELRYGPLGVAVDGGPIFSLRMLFAFVAMVVVMAVVHAGIAAAGLHRAVGAEVSFDGPFRYLDRAPRFVALSLLGALFSASVSFASGVGGGIVSAFVTVVLSLATLFVIDRDEGVWEAIKGAWGIVVANAGPVVLFALLSLALTIVGGLTLGIAFLWIVPFLSIAAGLMYVRSVGANVT
ncbi:MAG: hypothetical protein R6W77_02685 [Trueperaceae bacterium]